MIDTSEGCARTVYARAEMRPRRWYTDERAPPRRAARMTSALWRYRSLAQRRKNDAAPTTGAASVCYAFQHQYNASESHCGTMAVSDLFQQQDRQWIPS